MTLLGFLGVVMTIGFGFVISLLFDIRDELIHNSIRTGYRLEQLKLLRSALKANP